MRNGVPMTSRVRMPDVGRGQKQQVRSSAVRCPECGAEVGSPCVSAKGTTGGTHVARRRIALREGHLITSHEATCARCGRTRLPDDIGPHKEPHLGLACPGRTRA